MDLVLKNYLIKYILSSKGDVSKVTKLLDHGDTSFFTNFFAFIAYWAVDKSSL